MFFFMLKQPIQIYKYPTTLPILRFYLPDMLWSFQLRMFELRRRAIL